MAYRATRKDRDSGVLCVHWPITICTPISLHQEHLLLVVLLPSLTTLDPSSHVDIKCAFCATLKALPFPTSPWFSDENLLLPFLMTVPMAPRLPEPAAGMSVSARVLPSGAEVLIPCICCCRSAGSWTTWSSCRHSHYIVQSASKIYVPSRYNE